MGEICAQLKDPGRNGGRDLRLLHEHLVKDDLVADGGNIAAWRVRPQAGGAGAYRRSGCVLRSLRSWTSCRVCESVQFCSDGHARPCLVCANLGVFNGPPLPGKVRESRSATTADPG